MYTHFGLGDLDIQGKVVDFQLCRIFNKAKARKDQSAIFQLRTGHSKLNFSLNRFDPCHPPHCRSCTHPYETTEHVLFECLGLKTDREKLLPPSPTIGNTLYGSRSQLENTAKFYFKSLSSKS